MHHSSSALALYYCFVTIQCVQSIDTNKTGSEQAPEARRGLAAARVEDLPNGSCQTIRLPSGRELALYHVNGEFYATENLCPHQGAPLAAGTLCGHVIECDRHGWQFDVRTGECLTVTEKLETYQVVVDDGVIKIVV